MTEEYILSILLKGSDKEIQDEICNIIKPEHFYDLENAKIYEAVLYYHQKNVLANWSLVCDRFNETQFTCRDGNFNRLYELSELSSTTADYGYQVERMLEVVQRRNLLLLCEEIKNSAKNGAIPLEVTIQDISDRLDEIQSARPKKLQSLADDIKDEREMPEKERLFETGLYDLDYHYKLHSGHFVCIGGEPGMGKTSLALNLMASANQRGLRSLFISLEMARRDVIERLSAIVRQEPVYTQSKDRWDNVAYHNCFVDYGHAYTLQDITKLSYETKPDVIFIDNNLLLHSGKKTSNATEECKTISRQIKRLCMTQNVAVFLICHVNRAEGQKTGKPLTNARLYGSQAWEQDADMVLLLYPEHPEDKSEMILRIGKNRFGSLRDIPIDFHESQCRFSGKKFQTKLDCVID